MWEHTQREGVLDPGAFPAGPDLVEALAESESYDEAQAVVDVLADRASDQGHPWAWAGAQRGAALVEIHGDAYTDSAGAGARGGRRVVPRPGPRLRRGPDPADCSAAPSAGPRSGVPRVTSWSATVAAFEAIGSPGWADDARAELERVGARRSATTGGLTATERRVAELAVEGLANKEIARTLVVTVNTVEFHLRNTYAKLGIRSRVQLASALQGIDDPPPRRSSSVNWRDARRMDALDPEPAVVLDDQDAFALAQRGDDLGGQAEDSSLVGRAVADDQRAAIVGQRVEDAAKRSPQQHRLLLDEVGIDPAQSPRDRRPCPRLRTRLASGPRPTSGAQGRQ